MPLFFINQPNSPREAINNMIFALGIFIFAPFKILLIIISVFAMPFVMSVKAKIIFMVGSIVMALLLMPWMLFVFCSSFFQFFILLFTSRANQ